MICCGSKEDISLLYILLSDSCSTGWTKNQEGKCVIFLHFNTCHGAKSKPAAQGVFKYIYLPLPLRSEAICRSTHHSLKDVNIGNVSVCHPSMTMSAFFSGSEWRVNRPAHCKIILRDVRKHLQVKTAIGGGNRQTNREKSLFHER